MAIPSLPRRRPAFRSVARGRRWRHRHAAVVKCSAVEALVACVARVALVALMALMALGGGAQPAHAQLGDAGFVPALVPHTAQQPVVLGAGYVRWSGSNGAVARADAWFGRVGVAAAAGTLDAGGQRRGHGSASVLAELVPQGVGFQRPGVQLQAGYATHGFGGDAQWSVPVALGVLLHAPIPLPNRAHVLVHPALSVRHLAAGTSGVEGTSVGASVRALFTDRAGPFTHWGVHGYLRLLATDRDPGPRGEAALTRAVGRGASHGR